MGNIYPYTKAKVRNTDGLEVSSQPSFPGKAKKNALETNRDILDDGKYPITRYVVICNVIA